MEVGHAVAVDVAIDRRHEAGAVEAQFAGMVTEGRRSNETIGLVAISHRVGVEGGEVEPVARGRREVRDRVGLVGVAAQVRDGQEPEDICPVASGEGVSAGAPDQDVGAQAADQLVVAGQAAQGVIPGAPGEVVVQAVADAVEGAEPRAGEVLDIVAEGVAGQRGLDRIGPLAQQLDRSRLMESISTKKGIGGSPSMRWTNW